MHFYKHFYCLSFILHYHMSVSMKNKYLKYSAGLDAVSPCAVGLQFSTQINNTSSNDFYVELNPGVCCLELPGGDDCNVMEIEGCTEFIPKGTTKVLKLVAPILDPYERQGCCLIYIDSKPTDGHKIVMRDTLKIPFDTRIIGDIEYVKKCKELDEDPLNDCKPVNCDTYYNGKRSYFNSKTKKCAKIPNCINKNDPNVIYNPVSNECIENNSIGSEDLEFIKSLNDGTGRQAKDIILIKNFRYTNDFDTNNTESNDDNPILNFDKIDIKPKPKHVTKSILKKTKVKPPKSDYNPFMKYFATNRYTISAFGIIIVIQCCLICTLFYCMSQSCLCCKKKKVISKFFNYRQDASVTTPLIYTSNIDTDTTEFPYHSESSLNVDKKIKCYKACQKERKNDVKMSLSDDILSKCLNRRDWERKPRSETIREDNNERVEITEIKSSESKNISDHVERNQIDRKYTETKVNYVNEKVNDEKKNKVRITVADNESNSTRDLKKEFSGVQCDLSEKEIKCHSYNYMGDNIGSNATGFQANVQSKTFGMFKTERSKRGTISVSSEKGAQACFSNDSIDDFLSERGMIYLAENGSKYTLSSSTPGKSSSTSVSSRTSKKNVLKNVFSLFSRKSKHTPCSDPGLMKSNDNLDLQLLHISHASVYSSEIKDSRTSL